MRLRPMTPHDDFGGGRPGLWIVPRDGKPDARFKGKLLGCVTSGSEERLRQGNRLWCELYLWKLEDGRMAKLEVGRSAIPGKPDRFKLEVYANERVMLDTCERGPLTQSLYEESEIPDIEDI